MRRLELLIAEARRQSNNTRYDANSGVPQATFVQYFQNAQDELEKAAKSVKGKYFLGQAPIVTVVSGQEEYAYPYDIFMQGIDTLEWSQDGNTYFALTLATVKDRLNNQTGWAYGYIPRNEGYLLTPTLASGFLRVNYIKKVPQLQLRQGLITSRTINGSNQLTALTLNVADTSFDGVSLNEQNYLCVVNRNGSQLAVNIEYDSVNTTTGVVTITGAAFALLTTETVPVGAYITVGKSTANLPNWPTVVESYLIKYAIYQAKLGDSSTWTKAIKDDVAAMITSCIECLATPNDDISVPLVSNWNYLDV